MRRAYRVFIWGLLILGPIGMAGYYVISHTAGHWFERDLAMRARLAVSSARRSILDLLVHSDQNNLLDLFSDMTRDERLVAATLCSASGEMITSTELLPEDLVCVNVLDSQRRSSILAGDVVTWRQSLKSGLVHVTVVPILEQGVLKASAILVHDLGFAERRARMALAVFLISLGVLLVLAVIGIIILPPLMRKGWLLELKTALSSKRGSVEFQPLTYEVRGLISQLSREQVEESRNVMWNPARLRAALSFHLEEERIIVVSNREPYIHQRSEDGSIQIVHPASGLVTALEPVLRACSGVWVAHGSGSADRDTVDAADKLQVPPEEAEYSLRRIWLSEDEEKGYYYGFSNEGLWPLCHLAHERPIFRAADWEFYCRVNAKFADAVCQEAQGPDPIILVQDYHLTLVPKLIRQRLPRATILTFLHVPWPNAERFGICPQRTELLHGLLGSSIVGFHTQQHCNNFLDAVDRYIESRIDRERLAVVQGNRSTLIRAYPISIDWPIKRLAEMPDAAECRALWLKKLNLPENTLLGIGVDRLDYTKGVEERLRAVDTLLERYAEFRGRFVFIQLAAPSRVRIGAYQSLNDRVEQLTADINSRWRTATYQPIFLYKAHHEHQTVFQLYRAADLCYVSSLHDGMNLVAKEFVAARVDEQGVLVLSQFTGAAQELSEALIVNPYDFEEAAAALAAALRMPREEQRERIHAMRSLIGKFNIYRWAGRMVVDAAEVRRKERLAARLSPLPKFLRHA